MKKIIFIVLCTLLITATVYAEEKKLTVKSPSPNLELEFKRCVQKSNLTFIDVLIANTSQQDTKMECKEVVIYDNEGNVYNNAGLPYGKQRIYMATSNTNNQPLNSHFEIPAGISYKARFIVTGGFDEFATTIKLMKINFTWNVYNSKIYGSWVSDAFELRNFPITKDDN